MEILKRELTALYTAAREQRLLDLPQPVIQYADYAVWQRRKVRGQRLEALLQHWLEVLKGAPTFLELPTDRLRPAHQSFEGAIRTIRIPLESSNRLRDLARAHSVTRFSAVLATIAALLHRLSGQNDILIGTPVANRDRPELESVCGLIANTVVIRSYTRPDEVFSEMLDRIGAAVVSALASSELPFEKLVAELHPPRDPGYSPLFQVMFVYVERRGSSHGDRAAIEAANLEHRTAKFDLTFHVIADESGLLVSAEYAVTLFDAETIERWLSCLRCMIETIIASPETPVAALNLLTPDEQAALTQVTPLLPGEAERGPGMLHALVDEWVQRTPRAIAVEDGETALTFAELDAAAAALAQTLADCGAERGALVGIYLQRSHQFCVACLAVLRAGAACLVLDPEYPQDRLALMLADASPALVVSNDPPEWLARAQTCVPVHGAARRSSGSPSSAAAPADPAYIVYTSGSSGRPKGVIMPHGTLVNLVRWQLRRSGSPTPKTLQLAPLGFDVAFQEIFATWAGGGTLVCIPEKARRFPEMILATIDARRVERVFLPYVALDQLAGEVVRRGGAPACLREVITAGEALKITAHIAAWFESAKDCTLFNQYGPAETHVVTEERLEPPVSGWPVLPSVGRPINGVSVFIVDGQLEPVPRGVVGEIVVGGVAVAHGYLNRPEETAARFVELTRTRERVYRTGDIGRLDSRGRVEFLGRRDQQVKIRGFRIEPGEVEAALKAFDAISDAVVIAKGEDAAERHLVAFVVPRTSVESFDPQPISTELQRTLPEHLRPSLIVAVPEIPLTPSGKHDRLALARIQISSNGAEHLVKPRTELERQVAAVWRDVLGIDQIGVTENFFALGGHSLSATRLAAKLGEAFQIDLPVRVIFDAPTIEALSREMVISLVSQKAGSPLTGQAIGRERGSRDVGAN